MLEPSMMSAWKPRRWLPVTLSVCLIFITTVYLYVSGSTVEVFHQAESSLREMTSTVTVTEVSEIPAATVTAISTPATKPTYVPGKPEPDREYKKAIVVASIKSENTSWVAEQLPDVEPYIYVVDDPHAPLTVPRNWGNELMPYLTFIIDHYDKLPDVSIFVHAHEYTHLHNPAIFDYSTPKMVKALNAQRVVREGYMNLNCGDWKEGQCTAQIRPVEEQPGVFHRLAWEALFPEYPLPTVLAGSCCAQFAVSRERIRQVPLKQWHHFRDWLLGLEEENPEYFINPGYVWEYLWQFVLGGEHVFCPASHQCFCDGYGICFGGEEKFDEYMRLEDARETMRQNILSVDRAKTEAEAAGKELPRYKSEMRLNMITMMDDLDDELRRLRDKAWERGQDPEMRAKEL